MSSNSITTCYNGEHPNTATTTMPEEDRSTDCVEQTLWIAANRPARPESWAAMPDPTSPNAIFHTGPFGIDCLDALLDEPLQPCSTPRLEPFGTLASMSSKAEGTGTAMRVSGQRAWSPSHAEQPQFDGSWFLSQAAYSDQLPLSRAHSPCSGASPQPDLDLDFLSPDSLPDVPEGLESVDQLAVHIPLWPQLGRPRTAHGNVPAGARQ